MNCDTGAIDRAAEAVREIVERRAAMLEAAKETTSLWDVEGCERALLTARECLAAVERQR